jgi:hypothetical protein
MIISEPPVLIFGAPPEFAKRNIFGYAPRLKK